MIYSQKNCERENHISPYRYNHVAAAETRALQDTSNHRLPWSCLLDAEAISRRYWRREQTSSHRRRSEKADGKSLRDLKSQGDRYNSESFISDRGRSGQHATIVER